MSLLVNIVLLQFTFHFLNTFDGNIKIGLLYNHDSELNAFKSALYDKYILGKYDCGKGSVCPNIHFTAVRYLSNSNSLVNFICREFIDANISILISSSAHAFQKMSGLMPVSSYICAVNQIPVIEVSNRNFEILDEKTITWFLRIIPPWYHEFIAWIKMLKHLDWNTVNIISCSNPEGRILYSKFIEYAEIFHIKIEQHLEYHTGLYDYRNVLSALKLDKSKFVILQASKNDADILFKNLQTLKLFEKEFGWIVSENSLGSSFIPTGILGVKLSKYSSINGNIHDAVLFAKKAIKQACKNSSCAAFPMLRSKCNDEPTPEWKLHSKNLLKFLKKSVLSSEESESGRRINFDKEGNSINSMYDIVNVQQGNLKIVGKYEISKGNLDLDENEIQWIAGSLKKPTGVQFSMHLKVVTIHEIPFIYTTEKYLNECEIHLNKIPCPLFQLNKIKEYCCHGYAIDMLTFLAKETNFTYDLHLVGDGLYGDYELRNNKTEKSWNGMIGELLDGKANMILAPMTINPERAEHIDFSKPFKYQGLTILVKRTLKDSSLGSFLQPFEKTLWFLVALSVHFVALALYLLDRFSPFGRFKLAKTNDTEEDALNLSSAMWFSWGVLLNSGIGEGTPRSFSGRVLGMVWAGFAMIIVASYTANLAAFLVLDRPEAAISGIDDARLRNPQENFRYATVKNSAVSTYFRRQVELSLMYKTMEKHKNYDNPEAAIQDVLNGKLQAFIWDSSRLDFEAAKECKLVTAGEKFGRSSYGIGLAKDSPWTEILSLAILSFHEQGYMEHLDSKWIFVNDANCKVKQKTPATLGLANMAGVFIMVAGGIAAGVFLIIVEMAYKRRRGLKQKELEIAKTAANRWRSNIEKRKSMRSTLLQQQHQQQHLLAANSLDIPETFTSLTLPMAYQSIPFIE